MNLKKKNIAGKPDIGKVQQLIREIICLVIETSFFQRLSSYFISSERNFKLNDY